MPIDWKRLAQPHRFPERDEQLRILCALKIRDEPGGAWERWLEQPFLNVADHPLDRTAEPAARPGIGAERG